MALIASVPSPSLGFLSPTNIKAVLRLLHHFLHRLCRSDACRSRGGLDLHTLHHRNIQYRLLYLIGLGVPPWLALLMVIAIGAGIGFLNGVLTYRLQGQALILTLGMGFAVAGLVQILTSIGSAFSGNVFGTVPPMASSCGDERQDIRSCSSADDPALDPDRGSGDCRTSRLSIWPIHLCHRRQSPFSAPHRSVRVQILDARLHFEWRLRGAEGALLGWSGGGFIGVGDPYLFTTLAAVVIGGTSLAGGYGGYGFTVIGVLVLQVLSSFLIGIGLKYEWQQFIFGLLILPMVALYGRSPHIRSQV